MSKQMMNSFKNINLINYTNNKTEKRRESYTNKRKLYK